MKKTFKVLGIIFLVLILLLVATPFIFKGNLEKMLLRTINKNLNATVAWQSVDLSLFRNFPEASLKIQDFTIINKEPFAGDTLLSGKSLNLRMGIMQLFKSEDLKIDAFHLDEAFIKIQVDSLGRANYDIALEHTEQQSTQVTDADSDFSLALDAYSIKNSRIVFHDESLKTYLSLTDFNHTGKGDLSQDLTTLNTHSSGVISFKMDDTEYLSKHQLSLDALLELDLEAMKFTFLENSAKINELPLVFDGYVQLNETSNEIDVTFRTPSSDFKNFLAVIPKEYLKQIETVETTGHFSLNGKIFGIIDEEHIPKMDIKILSEDASFKYPDLPKKMEDITLDLRIVNETGLLKDLYVSFPKVHFKIDGEPFRLSGNAKNLMENPNIALEAEGTLDLGKLHQLLPLETKTDLSGRITADIAAHFDMASVEKEQYDKIDAKGNMELTNFSYNGGFKNPFLISDAQLSMTPSTMHLKKFDAKTGQTDLHATGTIHNLIAFVMGKQNLKGNFNLSSTTFDIHDFMTDEVSEASEKQKETSQPATSESIKIPDFLEASLNFNAQKVIYDNLVLTNAKGTATIKDETINITNFTSDIFGGQVAFSGHVTTKEVTPAFGVKLDLNRIDIDESFEKLDLFQFLAPIAKALHGNLNTNFELQGKLDKDLSPDLMSLNGKALARILTAEIDAEKAPIVSALKEKVSFVDWNKINLRDMSTHFSFSDGKIDVKPFDFHIKDVEVAVSGGHYLNQSMDYVAQLNIPAKYLGADITKLLQDLKPQEAEKLGILLPVKITGEMNRPQISVNAQAAIKELADALIAKQKDRLIDKGKDALSDFLDRNKKRDSLDTTPLPKQKDSTTTPTDKRQETTEKIKGLFDGLKGKRKKD